MVDMFAHDWGLYGCKHANGSGQQFCWVMGSPDSIECSGQQVQYDELKSLARQIGYTKADMLAKPQPLIAAFQREFKAAKH